MKEKRTGALQCTAQNDVSLEEDYTADSDNADQTEDTCSLTSVDDEYNTEHDKEDSGCLDLNDQRVQKLFA